MEWNWDLTVGVVELAHLIITIFLALLVGRIGWRFTNIRATKDLVLEEGRRSLQVCDNIRKSLRKVPDSEIPKREDFSEYLDDLGNYLDNYVRLYRGLSNESQLKKPDELNRTYRQLRVVLSEDKSEKEQDASSALTQLRKVENEIIDLMLAVNS